jgi:hypothetical protein
VTIGSSPIGAAPLAAGAGTLQSRNREVALQGLGYGQGSAALQGFYRRQDTGIIVPPDFAPTWGPKVYPKKSPRRRDRDDDVLLFLLR